MQQVSSRFIRVCVLSCVLVLFFSVIARSQENDGSNAAPDPLIQVLVNKGVLTAQEGKAASSGSPAEQRQRLLNLLKEKGILSAADYNQLASPPASAQVSPALVASAKPMVPSATAAQAATTPAIQPSKPAPPKVIPAFAPLRVLQLEPSPPNGMIPDIKLGSGAKIKLYGLVKASVIYDSSAPYGTDMPLSGFISTGSFPFDPGPNGAPEFHAKARFMRFGTNFEWPDASKDTAITGKFEFDFEGNYTRALNRNISTIRSSQASIRLAYGRIDHKLSDNTSVFALFGQDWTPFGSSTLPAIYETTGLGLGFGTLYERAPQFRFGFGHKAGTSRNLFFQPEFAVVMPAYGNDPASVDNQLGFGERQGADSARPEVQARFVTQWQLDKAPGVAPAQLIFSAVQGRRTALIRAANVPTCTAAGCPSATVFQTAFPHGAEVSSERYGWTGELQLPTRYVTILAKVWSGADLRFFFVGSLFSNFNDAGVLDMGAPTVEALSNDGSSAVIFGFRGGAPVVAPQRPVRAKGFFTDLGFPLSRIFNADPASRAAGWSLNLHYALDAANPHDVLRIGSTRQKNDLAAGTLNYKLNNLVTFTIEESLYRTRVVGDPTKYPAFEGMHTREWHDFRSEIGPTFTF